MYVSAWLKRHEPAAFLAALLNSQPMGFYAPSPAGAGRAPPRRRGAAGGRARERVGLHPGARTRGGAPGACASGLRLVKGLCAGGSAAAAGGARAVCSSPSVADLAAPRRARPRASSSALAAAGALARPGRSPPPRGVGGGRRRGAAAAAARAAHRRGAIPLLRAPARGRGHRRRLRAALGLTLRRHPLAVLRRDWRSAAGVVGGRGAARVPTASGCSTAGIVVCRQHPASAARRGVRHAGGRNRQHQRDRLAPTSSNASGANCCRSRLLVRDRRAAEGGRGAARGGAAPCLDRSVLLGALVTPSRDFR
ncbi:MAG: hypothetical protein MZV65_34605 [Chromatiales bacterium]|nr:hypothetical protein [Chromatiales bacterium]